MCSCPSLILSDESPRRPRCSPPELTDALGLRTGQLPDAMTPFLIVIVVLVLITLGVGGFGTSSVPVAGHRGCVERSPARPRSRLRQLADAVRDAARVQNRSLRAPPLEGRAFLSLIHRRRHCVSPRRKTIRRGRPFPILLIAAGVELVELSKVLGHSDIRITGTLYTHLMEQTPRTRRARWTAS